MKHTICIALITFWCLLTAGIVQAATLETLVNRSMVQLSVNKSDPDLLVITNASHVKYKKKDCLKVVRLLEEKTGCSVGQKNMLFFQRPQNHPLRIALFTKNTGDTMLISRENDKYVAEKINMSMDRLVSRQFWKESKHLTVGRDIFTLATFAGCWTLNAPYDYFKCAELHNHICPGMTSGYLIAKTIQKEYPLKAGEAYTFVSCPTWCKEDALQVMLDLTPGKHRMVVKNLTEDQTKSLPVKDPAGILLIWNKAEKKGRGIVFSMDFKKATALVPQNAPKAAVVFALVPFLDQPEAFVSSITSFDLTQDIYDQILATGTNPYTATGIFN